MQTWKNSSFHTNCVAALGPDGNIWLNFGDSGLTSCCLLFRFLKVSIKMVKFQQTLPKQSPPTILTFKIIHEQRRPVQLAWCIAPASEDFAQHRIHLQSPNMSPCHQTPSWWQNKTRHSFSELQRFHWTLSLWKVWNHSRHRGEPETK